MSESHGDKTMRTLRYSWVGVFEVFGMGGARDEGMDKPRTDEEKENRVRQSHFCPLCDKIKDLGLVACWSCYRQHGLRSGNPRAEAIIHAAGERLGGVSA